MQKTILLLGLLSLGARGAEPIQREPMKLKEERMSIEYTVTSGEATLIVQAESELNLGRVIVSAPNGRPVMDLRSSEQEDRSLQGFVIEMKELNLPELLQSYSPGTYRMNGRTSDGKLVKGSAALSHFLPDAPVVTYPLQGETVETTFDVTWAPVPGARAYQIVLEQGDNDNLTAELPAGIHFFSVPPGILAPGLESHVEVGAVADNGNRTVVEVEFRTR